MARWVLALLCACTGAPSEQGAPPPTSSAPAQGPAAPAVWRIEGRLDRHPSTGSGPPPFEGARALLAQCGDRAPCSAELLRGPEGTVRGLVRGGGHLVWSDDRSVWPAEWTRINGALDYCLGDPLGLPPAGDPAGMRVLVWEERGPWWWIRLSGDNRCALGGTLKLQSDGRTVDTDALTAGELAWSVGGREHANGHLRAHRRQVATTDWDTLSPEERASLLVLLRTDPEAASLVAQLEAGH